MKLTFKEMADLKNKWIKFKAVRLIVAYKYLTAHNAFG